VKQKQAKYHNINFLCSFACVNRKVSATFLGGVRGFPPLLTQIKKKLATRRAFILKTLRETGDRCLEIQAKKKTAVLRKKGENFWSNFQRSSRNLIQIASPSGINQL
jgi:hypothetical protein